MCCRLTATSRMAARTVRQMATVVTEARLMRPCRTMPSRASRQMWPQVLSRITVDSPLLVTDDPPVPQGDHPLPHGVDDGFGMGGHQNGGAPVVDVFQKLHDAPGRFGVQVARGLVAQEQGRPG